MKFKIAFATSLLAVGKTPWIVVTSPFSSVSEMNERTVNTNAISQLLAPVIAGVVFDAQTEMETQKLWRNVLDEVKNSYNYCCLLRLQSQDT